MPVKFHCPECRARLTVASRYAGRRGKCPKCQRRIDIPDAHVRSMLAREEAGDTPHDSLTDPEHQASSEDAVDEGGEDSTERGESASSRADWKQTLPLPRWIVYAQGALLAIIATSFFVFGLMVGLNTRAPAKSATGPTTAQVSGGVYYDTGSYRRGDFGAVVMLLPCAVRPDTRPDGHPLNPNSYVPLENESRDALERLGGEVVRVGDDGTFQMTVPAGQPYWLLVISKNQSARVEEIPKQTRAELGAYFFPVEDLLGDRPFHWSQLHVTGSELRCPDVVF